MPPRWVLVGLLLLAFGAPLLARGFGSVAGRYSMFTRLERYRIELEVRTPKGPERVRLRELKPHLSQEAQRILLPADGYALGADQVDLVAGGLGDLTVLLCTLRPDANSAKARLLRGSLRERTLHPQHVELRCPR